MCLFPFACGFLLLAIFMFGVPLVILLAGRSRESARMAKIWLLVSLITTAGYAVMLGGNRLSWHIRRGPYIRTLKSYVPQQYRGKVPRSFFTQCGMFDHWRFALVYPYEVNCIDALEWGFLDTVEGPEVNIGGCLTHLAFDGRMMVARVQAERWGDGAEDVKWIVLDFSSGYPERFAGEAEAMRKAKSRGFTGGKPEQLRFHYERFDP